jgi:hypothetical protein
MVGKLKKVPGGRSVPQAKYMRNVSSTTTAHVDDEKLSHNGFTGGVSLCPILV